MDATCVSSPIYTWISWLSSEGFVFVDGISSQCPISCFSSNATNRSSTLDLSDNSGYFKMFVAPLVYTSGSSSLVSTLPITSSTESITVLSLFICALIWEISAKFISVTSKPLSAVFNTKFNLATRSGSSGSLMRIIWFFTWLLSSTITASKLFSSTSVSWMNLTFLLW